MIYLTGWGPEWTFSLTVFPSPRTSSTAWAGTTTCGLPSTARRLSTPLNALWCPTRKCPSTAPAWPHNNFCWDSLFRCKTISLPVLGYGSYFCPNIRKGNIFKIVSIYQPMHISISTYQLVYIQCRQRRLFHGWNASSTIGELEVVGYIQVWAATVSRWETNKPQI